MYRNSILEMNFVFIFLYGNTIFKLFCISVLKYIFGRIPRIAIISGVDASRYNFQDVYFFWVQKHKHLNPPVNTHLLVNKYCTINVDHFFFVPLIH